MKKMLIILSFVSILSCKHSEITKEDIIGNWYSEKITLEVTETNIIRKENGNKIVYNNYSISKDTLKLIQESKFELHLISLKNGKLIFNPINAFEKDIQLMDQTIFVKKE
ncbi:hypothetical protein TPENAI_61188 [Tenacibaculum litopenaei]|uniref:hypothetical protein n=1 Tax=Tenacibaculum litopenaei TaxID=396016 RepID=UPI003894760B